MIELVLFEMQPLVVEPPAKLSPDRRRTLRQHTLVELGVHPLARRPTKPELGTCGDCRFRELISYRARTYPKCTRFPERVNHSAGTDCRAWWPACGDWEPKDEDR